MERIGWTIRFGDKSWRESELTLAEAALFQELTGESWPRSPVASANELFSLLAIFVSRDDPGGLDGALAALSSLSMVDALGMATPGEE